MDNIFIGTSGYSYQHWKEIFYPEDLPQNKWLEYYQNFFDTVELNNSFYRLPREIVFKNWAKRVKDNFTFAVKGSRFITHIKRLKEAGEPLNLLLSRISYLGGKLGPILFQLPPSFEKDIKRIEDFLELLPEKYRYAFEFRNNSWFNEDCYRLLKKYNVAFCDSDLPELKTPMETADFVYIRRHGPGRLYGSSYSNQQLKDLSDKIRAYLKSGDDVYVYFNNDFGGYAIENALFLKKLLKK